MVCIHAQSIVHVHLDPCQIDETNWDAKHEECHDEQDQEVCYVSQSDLHEFDVKSSHLEELEPLVSFHEQKAAYNSSEESKLLQANKIKTFSH